VKEPGRHARSASIGNGKAPSTAILQLLAICLALLALAPAASADVTTRAQVGSFGPDGTGTSLFPATSGFKYAPYELAFDQSAQRLFARDAVLAKLYAFDVPANSPAGGAFPLSLDANGDLGAIAVDNSSTPSAGRIYFLSRTTNPPKVHAYSPAGIELNSSNGHPGFPISVPTSQFGLCGAYVDTQGNLYLGDSEQKLVREYDSSGTSKGNLITLPPSSTIVPCDIAIDNAGDAFVHQGGGNSVYKFSSADGYKNPTTFFFGYAAAIALDRSADVLYVARQDASISTRYMVSAYDTSGDDLYDFGQIESPSGNPLIGLAVDEDTNTVYVSDSGVGFGDPNGRHVIVFGPAQDYPDAAVTLNPATNIDYTRADLSASIDDNGPLPTNWRFQISPDGGSSWYDASRFSNNAIRLSGQTNGGASGVITGGTVEGYVDGAQVVALQPSSDYSFRVITNKGYTPATEASSSSLPFSTLVAPDATANLNPAANVTATSADLSASIDDNGPLGTHWRFQLSNDDGGSWQAAKDSSGKEIAGITDGGGTGIPISGTAAGLVPNTDYSVRVITNKGTSPAHDVPSTALPFHTIAVPPVATTDGAAQVTDTSATLVGTVNPQHSASSYVFEYGTAPGSLDQVSDPVDVGSGIDDQLASIKLENLDPGTDYYLKLVATNSAGATEGSIKLFHTLAGPLPLPSPPDCPNQEIRSAQGSEYLPDCRAYEMVSPPDKNLGDVDNIIVAGTSTDLALAPDGDAAAFCTTALFGEPPSQLTQFCAPYVSRRTVNGWQTTNPLPPLCRVDPTSGGLDSYRVDLSADFSALALSTFESSGCSTPPIDSAAPLPGKNLYLRQLAGQPSNTLLAPAGHTLQLNQASVSGDADFSHVVFASTAKQSADAADDGTLKLYEWIRQGEGGCAEPGGCLHLVSKDNAGDPLPGSSALVSVGGSNDTHISDGAVSADGRRIFFNNPTNSGASCAVLICKLHMREDGVTTYNLSASECTVSCGNAAAKPDAFLAATTSGGEAFFVSCAKLTDASSAEGSCSNQPDGGPPGSKLYRWSETADGSGHNLIDLSTDHQPADGSQPNFKGLIDISSEESADPDSDAFAGNTAYFVAGGQIVAGAPTGSFDKLYRWRWNGGVPIVDYLGPFQALTAGASGVEPNLDHVRHSVSSNGLYLLLTTKLRYDPAADRDADADLYRWSEADGFVCISCQAPDVLSSGDVQLKPVDLSSYSNLSSPARTWQMSADGRRAFFASGDALVPEDVNGEGGCPTVGGYGQVLIPSCMDVYEWHDGVISLVSSGTGTGPAQLIGTTPSGDDVAFTTGQRLVGWDTDNNVDIYDARTDGGFSEPPPSAAGCEAEACRGAGTSASTEAGAGTASFEGPADPSPNHRSGRRRHKHHKHKRHHKTHSKNHGRAAR